MVFSQKKRGLAAAVGLLVLVLFLAACSSDPTLSGDDHLGPTTSTTLFPEQRSFEQELTGEGYEAAIVFGERQGSTTVVFVWIGVDLSEADRATSDVIFDHAVSLAKEYQVAEATGGLLRVELFKLGVGGFIKDQIFESRDFDLSSGDPVLPEEMASDFAFVASCGVGARNVLDTFEGTFTKDIVSPSKPNPTAEFQLTPGEMAELYEELVAIDILSYPDVFRPQLEDSSLSPGTTMMVTPHSTYLLHIRAAGIEKYTSWEDVSLSATPSAVALRDWFGRLRQMIEATPEYEAMPPAEGGYP